IRWAPTRAAHISSAACRAVRAAASRDTRRSTVTVATSTGTPRRAPSTRTKSPSLDESGRSWWSTCSTWSRRRHEGASAISRCSSATESAPPDTPTKTVSPPASIAWRRRVRSTWASSATSLAALETHPDLAVLEVLLLPHGHGALQRVDRVPARLERVAAMRRGDRYEHAGFADLEPPDAVEHRHPLDAAPAPDGGPRPRTTPTRQFRPLGDRLRAARAPAPHDTGRTDGPGRARPTLTG